MYDWLTILMRWIHITSMATLIGGMIFGRLVMARSLEGVAPETRSAVGDRAAAAYKPLVLAAIFGSLISGLFKFLTAAGHSARYHGLFGLKMLLVLHVYAVAILVVQPKNERRPRLMTGVVFSGLAIILISAWLKTTF